MATLVPLKYFQILTLDIHVFDCMCICCLDVDCMNAYMIIMSLNVSFYGAYCFYYVRMYVRMHVCMRFG